ncbi:hypothetical protein TomTYG75_07060 [Sphingobium sp. TomTYG75]
MSLFSDRSWQEHLAGIRNKTPSRDFTPCERTVRMCIEAIVVNAAPKQMMDSVYSGALSDAKGALQALLPDPAKTLVEKWEETGCHIPKGRTAYEAFAQFLIDTGRIRSGE